MLINSQKVFTKLIGSEEERKIFNEEVVFEAEDNAGERLFLKIENKEFHGLVKIDGDNLGNVVFVDCDLGTVDLGPNIRSYSIQFIKCKVDKFQTSAFGEVSRCLFQDCLRINHLDVHHETVFGRLLIVGNSNIGNMCIKANVEQLIIRGKYSSSSTNAEHRVPLLEVNLGDVKCLDIYGLSINKLMLRQAGADTRIRLETISLRLFAIEEFRKPDLRCYQLVPWESNKKLDVTFLNSDLGEAVFHHCNFNGRGSIYSSKLREIDSFETNWPRLYGEPYKSLMNSFRELKLLHQNIGDYRRQFDYHEKEMEAFKKSEWERLKSMKGTSTLVKEAIEYFVKVKLPSFASDFGLSSWKPILLYIMFLIVAVNGIILCQGSEIGVIYIASINPLNWDWSLFWHLFLPVHGREFNGVLLNTGIDVVWRVLSSFFLYHIILSSRKLLQQR